MQVYVEFALAENFCMDFTLLYAAKTAVKNQGKIIRIVLAAALGAVFAVVFPLFKLPAILQVLLKVVSGFALCLVAGRFQTFKSFVKFALAFAVLCAVLGGAIIGAFSLAGTEYLSGGGYLISSVPVGIPLFGALVVFLGAKALARRLSKSSKNTVKCRIYAGQSSVSVNGFYDSGNKVYFRGAPVSVIPEEVAFAVCNVDGIKDGVKIHTVAGSKVIKVFTADRIDIDDGQKIKTFKKVLIGVSPQRINSAVLHCDLLEE